MVSGSGNTFIVVWLAEYSVKIAVFLVKIILIYMIKRWKKIKIPGYLEKNVRKNTKIPGYLERKTFGKKGFNVIPLHLFIYALIVYL